MPRGSSTPQRPSRPWYGRLAPEGCAADQWRLLVRLPAEIMVTTIWIREGAPRRTVPEGLAGLDAIAAGRLYDSDLVRAVVAAIFAEPEDDRSEDSAPQAPADRRALVLADCRKAVAGMRGWADPADAAAYRHWVLQVAVRVCRATLPDGSAAPDWYDRLSPAERLFLADLSAVLA